MKKQNLIFGLSICILLLCVPILNAQYAVGEKIEAEDLEISGIEYDCLLVGHGEDWIIENYPDGYPSNFIYGISGNAHWLCGDYAPERMPNRCKSDWYTGDEHCCDKYVSVPIDIPETGDYVIYAFVMNFPDSACLIDNRGCEHKTKWEGGSWFLAWDDPTELDKLQTSGGDWNVAGDLRKTYHWMVFPYEVYCAKFNLDTVIYGKSRNDCKLSSPIGCDFPPEKFNLKKGNHTLYLKVAYEFTCIDWLMIKKAGDPAPESVPGRTCEGCGTDVEENPVYKPEDFVLEQNYPNPFNARTTISYFLPRTSMVELNIYNISGQKVANVVNSVQSHGYHVVSFDASGLSSGIYIYEIEANCTAGEGEGGIVFKDKKEMLLMK
jgi:hypothetical protein